MRCIMTVRMQICAHKARRKEIFAKKRAKTEADKDAKKMPKAYAARGIGLFLFA